MLSVIKKCLLFGFFLNLSACIISDTPSGGFFGSSTDSCNFSVDRIVGSGIKWDKSNLPVVFYIHESVPEKGFHNFVSALDHWNLEWEEYLAEKGLSGPPLFSLISDESKFSGVPKNDNYNMLFFTNDFSSYGTDLTQAVTVINSRRGEIKDADIVVNAKAFKFYYDNKYNQDVTRYASNKKESEQRSLASSRNLTLREKISKTFFSFFRSIKNLFMKDFKSKRQIAFRDSSVPSGHIDFPSLMIHELGHVPGLGHTDHKSKVHSHEKDGVRVTARRSSSSRSKASKINSVMDPKLPAGHSRRQISAFDLSNLFCGYYENQK